MVVLYLSLASNKLKGSITRWMSEIAPGFYVGDFSKRIRDEIWEMIKEETSTIKATMVFNEDNELGYNFLTLNTDYMPIDFDGLSLITKINKSSKSLNEENAQNKSSQKNWSKASHYRFKGRKN